MHLPSIQNMSTGQVIRLALLISVTSLIGWVIVVAGLWALLHALGVAGDYWPMLEALSTAGAVAQFLGGGTVALWQLRDSVDSRNMSTFNDIFEKMMADREIEARRWIYTQLPADPAEGLARIGVDGQEHVKHVLNRLDHLGFLLEQDWITAEAEDAVVRWVSPMAVKLWARLGPYVDYEAQRRNEPDYYANVRLLAERCIEWRKKNLPGSEVKWIDKAL